MADDGMLLNFEVGDLSYKPPLKFKGGRWRDRVRVQRIANKARRRPSDTAPSIRERLAGDGEADSEGDRAAKRQKTLRGTEPRIQVDPAPSERPGARNRSSNASTKPSAPSKPGQQPSSTVTSRLFTSNPTPKTVFGELVLDAEPAEPSNAPLSEEAESFHALGLSRRVSRHLSDRLGLKTPTSIQKNTIPLLARQDSDVFLQAETGSGKTLAYLLPMIHRILALGQHSDGTSNGTKIHRGSGLLAIVLAPTRELCKQLATVLEKLLRCAPWIVGTTVTGGESKKSEKARLRKGVNILVATPGRLVDHLDNTKVLDAGTVRWLVLDEGDRLMEMGFEEELRSIVSKIRRQALREANKDGVAFSALPQRRVTVLCSATMKMNVQRLGDISLQDAVHISTSSADDMEKGVDAETDVAIFATPSQLKQSYIVAPAKLRLVTLIALLKSSFARKGSVMKAIIFMSCADSVDFHYELLCNGQHATPVAAESRAQSSVPAEEAAYITSPANPTVQLLKLHGSLAQPLRTSTLASFKAATDPCVLITTDIASRGLDVPSVDLVVEYDPAFSAADHVHRVGRTARAGRPGRAALFLLPGCEEGYVSLLRSATPPRPESYQSVLQKGFVSPVAVPAPPGDDAAVLLAADKPSPNARAEALQLHIERRLLAPAGDGGGPRLLDAARRAFRSHVRAYATHVRDERAFFDITQLHLGHLAKSYGLREAPAGIGGGPSRRSAAARAPAPRSPGVSAKRAGDTGPVEQDAGGGGRGDAPRRREGGRDAEPGGRRDGALDGDAATRMKMMVRTKGAMGAGAEEFNIG